MPPRRHPESVVVFDLAGDIKALLDPKQQISRLQTERVPAVAEGTIDAGRVLCRMRLPGDARAGEAVARITGAPSVDRTICVISGPPQASDPSRQIELPAEFLTEAAVALWVGDPRGVVWAVGTAKATRITVFEDDPDGDGALETLCDCLRLPEVFDAVFEAAQAAQTVVSPALRVIVPGISEPKLIESASVSALQTLHGSAADAATGVGELPESLEHRPELVGKSVPPADLYGSDGQVGRLTVALERARTTAAQKTGNMIAYPTRPLIAECEQLVRQVGETLDSFRDGVKALFAGIEATDGLSAAEERKLKRAGLLEDVLAAYTQRGAGLQQEETVREFALAEIREHKSLVRVGVELRALATRAVPRSSEHTTELLESVLPVDLVHRLKAHRPVRLRFDQPWWLPALLALSVGAAGWWPGLWRLLAYGIIAALGLYLASLAVRPLPHPRELPKLVLQGAHTPIFWEIAAAVAIGLFILGLLLDSVFGSLWLETAGIVVSPIAMLAFARGLTRRSMARWISDTGLEHVKPTITATIELLRDVTVNDWLLANQRTHFEMTVSRLAESVEKMRETIAETLVDLHAGSGGAARTSATPCNPAVRADLSSEGIDELHRHADVIEDIVLSDHLDAITAAIESEWTMLTAKASSGAADDVNAHLRRWISEYRGAIAERGLFGAGMTAAGGEDDDALTISGRDRRRDLLSDLWHRIPVDTMLGDVGSLVQLCSAEDLGMLDQASEGRLIRFVPSDRAPERKNGHWRAVSTVSLLMAGVLRLVALRPGSVKITGVPADENVAREAA